MRPFQPLQTNIVTRTAPTLPNVLEQFKALDFQNRELLKLADHVQKSTFLSKNGPPPHIINRLQQDLRRNLSVLIESIREVFMDMDKRLRALAQVIQQQQMNQKGVYQNGMFSSPQRPKENTFYSTSQTTVDPYQSLVERISSLEMHLKNTQQNQAKLIAIIERMERMDRRTRDQPTITSELKNQMDSKFEKDFSTQHIEKSSLMSENSFRLFALRTHDPSQNQYVTHHRGQNQNHNRNYNSSKLQAQDRDKVSMTKPKRQAVSMNPFLCFGQPQNESLQPSRIQPQYSGVNYQKNYASTHSHRLNFMMNTLTS